MSGLKMILFCLGVITLITGVSVLSAGDWPQWGRDSSRNMASDEKGLPDTFDPGTTKSDGSGIDMTTTTNVKWAAKLGSQTYGNPVVASGKVFVGTNDFSLDDPRLKVTNGGLIACFDEQTGKKLWQLPIPRWTTQHPRKEAFGDFNYERGNYGVCSSPTVEDGRVYVVSSRGEVLCLDADGQADGNDGPFQDEGKYMAGPDKDAIEILPTDADIIWLYDILFEIPSHPEDAFCSSIVIHKDLLYVGTSNGVNASHREVPFAEAASFIALDKKSGKLIAWDDEKIGRRIYHGQWSSPSLGEVDAKTLIFYGGGNGICYAFEALNRIPKNSEAAVLKKVWSFDCNPPEYKFRDGKPLFYARKSHGSVKKGYHKGPCEIIATPVFYQNRVYVAIGQDPRHGKGEGILSCIDASKRGEVRSESAKTDTIWTSKLVDRSLSTVSIADGLLYIADTSSNLHCFDAETGERYWTHDLESMVWSSTLVADGKVYIGTEKRLFWILKAGKDKQVLARIRLSQRMYTTPIAANGVLFFATQKYLYAVHVPQEKKE